MLGVPEKQKAPWVVSKEDQYFRGPRKMQKKKNPAPPALHFGWFQRKTRILRGPRRKKQLTTHFENPPPPQHFACFFFCSFSGARGLNGHPGLPGRPGELPTAAAVAVLQLRGEPRASDPNGCGSKKTGTLMEPWEVAT